MHKCEKSNDNNESYEVEAMQQPWC